MCLATQRLCEQSVLGADTRAVTRDVGDPRELYVFWWVE